MKYVMYRYPSVDSTNSVARALPPGSVVVADRQTAGRGRRGRTFSSEGGGLYMSVVLRPEVSADRLPRITTAAAVAVAEALGDFGCEAGIKWVNDLYRGARKICGILTEGVVRGGGEVEKAILGIGINLTPPPGGFPPEIMEIAGAAFDADAPEAEAVCGGILAHLDPYLARIGEAAAPHMEAYRRRCFTIGQAVLVTPVNGEPPYEAIAEDVDDECGLIVRRGGERLVLSSAEVSARGRG